MIGQSTRRPLSSWRAVLRRSRQLRQHQHQHQLPPFRTMATATTTANTTASSPPPPPPPSAADIKLPKPKISEAIGRRRRRNSSSSTDAVSLTHSSRHGGADRAKSNRPQKPVRSAFAVYPRVASARAAEPAALLAYHAQQQRRLDRTGARGALFAKGNADAAKPGDVLQVTTRGGGGGEPFAGVCLVIRRAGVDTAVLLRNHVARVPVEMWFKIYSPNVAGIEIVWRRPKRARRARLTYMRKPKHDMGNVDHLVDAWRRTRNVFTSKGRGAAGKGAKGARPGARR
ncbi:translation protein SH3-like domain-containing protein [Durotheca rogersii]|uniref:translation protein SH3-like domain-containing protein n=1 Tax=Durotheca rogersii TaxID=419775 RepID=UPI00221F9684|nr:translation protein SH3-like domain-containing protein [Durotheca rogersii]KAI5867970.1 translation protein SH3-like domain-containing protein [Durotheca rogersii]